MRTLCSGSARVGLPQRFFHLTCRCCPSGSFYFPVDSLVPVALRLLNRTFHIARAKFSLKPDLLMLDGIYMYQPTTIIAETYNLGMLSIVLGAHLDTDTFIVDFKWLLELNRFSMGFISSVGYPLNFHGNSSVLTSVNGPRIEPVWQELSWMYWSHAKRLISTVTCWSIGLKCPWEFTFICRNCRVPLLLRLSCQRLFMRSSRPRCRWYLSIFMTPTAHFCSPIIVVSAQSHAVWQYLRF